MPKFTPRPLLTIKRNSPQLPSNWVTSSKTFKKLPYPKSISNTPIKQAKLRKPSTRMKQYGDPGYKPSTGGPK